MADILSFDGSKTKTDTVKPGRFEFHLYPTITDSYLEPTVKDDIVEAEGYLMFGPAFIAVVDSQDEKSNVVYAVAAPGVRYIKRISDEGHVEATLSPG